MSPELRKAFDELTGRLGIPSVTGAGRQLSKNDLARQLLKSISAPLVVTGAEPDANLDPAGHAQYVEKKQRAQFTHFVKVMHALGPDEVWDPRHSGALAAYRHHG